MPARLRDRCTLSGAEHGAGGWRGHHRQEGHRAGRRHLPRTRTIRHSHLLPAPPLAPPPPCLPEVAATLRALILLALVTCSRKLASGIEVAGKLMAMSEKTGTRQRSAAGAGEPPPQPRSATEKINGSLGLVLCACAAVHFGGTRRNARWCPRCR